MNGWLVALIAVTLLPPLMVLAVMRLRPKRTLSADYCRTCDTQLAHGRIYEIRTNHEADRETGGGTYLAVTYCRRHAPQGAVRC